MAVVAASGTVNVMHCLEVLGDLAGVHATPADSDLIGECLLEYCIGTDAVIPGFGNLVVGVAIPYSRPLTDICYGLDKSLTYWSVNEICSSNGGLDNLLTKPDLKMVVLESLLRNRT